ncbi:hypothetical protein CAL13_09445 [Bordetella genomosp. 9]|uniref:DUF4232 domain-containing protein n=1 Tax=Bordetella genomosp. 9 TaxID=1416803 RepID=A0A1W6YZ66_9BORD|nr:hypothetical protein CAL13_09445 [Bordetella genomosp. 9]
MVSAGASETFRITAGFLNSGLPHRVLFFAALVTACVLAAIGLPAQAQTGTSAAPDLPLCDPASVSFAADTEDGWFVGMSQSGTLLVLRNLGPVLCAIPARPQVGFLDAKGQPLAVEPESPKGMHPGPVIPPVAVPVNAELTSEMRWVSADAYGDNNCVTAAYITLELRGYRYQAPFSTQLCGPKGRKPVFAVTLLRRDPPYQPPTR